MEKMIKELMKVLGDYDGSVLNIQVYPSEIAFLVYEQEIPICIDIKKKYVYLDTETCSSKLTKDMVRELSEIMNIIEKNIDNIVKIFL